MTFTAPKGTSKEIADAFNGVVAVLTESGVIGSIEASDLYGIEIVATQIVRMRNAQKALERDGEYVEHTNKNGSTNIQKHPAMQTEQQAAAIILRWSLKLGLAPADRAKLASLDTSSGDDLNLD